MMFRKMLNAAIILALLTGVPAQAADLTIRIGKTRHSSVEPFDKEWNNVKAVRIPLMPQTIAPPGGGGAVKAVSVKVLRTEREIFFRLVWRDATVDDYPSKAEGFTDAVALQFPAQPATWPSLLMGDRENAVSIWRWSASAQKDLDEGYQSSRAHRPRQTADLYAYAGDVTFRTAEGAGNIIANRRRVSSVESLAARGFGTLTTTDDQPVSGKGVWRKGLWYVVVKRDLNGTPDFWKGTRMPFAVAVWDGRAKERNGMKSLSPWHTLEIGAPARKKESQIAQGRRHYTRYGCIACHGKDALQGIANPNAQTDPITALYRLKEGFSREEALEIIMEGREPARKIASGPPPPFRMNAWETVLSKDEADRIIDYLFSLQPAEEEW